MGQKTINLKGWSNDQPFFNIEFMENLIDDTYFWGELELGNLFKNTNGNLLSEAGNNASNELQMFITKYQKKYLTEMFGKTLAANLPAELIALIRDEDAKTSPIANYVYFFAMRNKQSVTSKAGEVRNSVVNTQIETAGDKMKNAWFEMVQFNLALHQDLYDTETLEYETPLSYLNDIYPEIKENSSIFKPATYGI